MTKPDPLAGYVRIGSVASELGIHRDTVVRMAEKLHVPVYRFGGSRKLRKTHLQLLRIYVEQSCARQP